MTPARTLERIWICYLASTTAIALATPSPGGAAHRPWAYAAIQAALLLAVLAARLVGRRAGPGAMRWWLVVVSVAGCPIAFSALGLILPGVHPEPFEYVWLAWDRALFGTDVARFADGRLSGWFAELLQLVYASFYVIPIGAALGARRGRGAAAFDRATTILVGAFLCSYLGYLLVPTLGPKTVLPQPDDLHGVWLLPTVRAAIDAAEANLWDCFPSGHTMLSLVSLIVLWRWCRRGFWVMLVPVLLLIASTMVLRYHWAIDVLAGALLAWPTVRIIDWLLDRDGWPAAAASEQREVPAV